VIPRQLGISTSGSGYSGSGGGGN